jgi:hypothetical protein
MIGGRRAVLLVGLGMVLFASGCGSGSHHPQTFVLGRDAAVGSRAAAEASVTVSVAKGLSVRVTTRPSQRVSGSWTIFCHAAAIGSARDADDFSGKAPLTVAMRDVTFGDASISCNVVADARLAKAGRLKVEIVTQ